MGLFDNLGQFGQLASLVTKNPQAIAAVASLLSSKDASVGGTGGIGGLIQAFQGKGMGDMVASWISTGPNPSVSASQVSDALGDDTIKQFAAKAGVSHGDAGGLLASLLPSVVDHLTPDGKLPDAGAFESALGGLLGGFKR